jgi:poly(3-hydroxybutyrate) depolymerase
MNNVAPGSEVAVRVERDGKPMELRLKAARPATRIPEELPAAYPRSATVDSPVDVKAGETRELKLAEFPQQCKVYIPASHDAGRAQGILMWLHAPAEAEVDEVIRKWEPICNRDSVILVVPTAAEANRWERTELEYLRRLLERVVAQYRIDRQRIVVYGRGGGGAMAWMLGISSRDLVRGVATSAAPLPRQIRVPDNEPSQRLAVFAALPADKNAATQIAIGLEKLSDAGYPATTITTGDRDGRLSDPQRDELARWIDMLDRF